MLKVGNNMVEFFDVEELKIKIKKYVSKYEEVYFEDMHRDICNNVTTVNLLDIMQTMYDEEKLWMCEDELISIHPKSL